MRGERARLGECLAACGALVGTGARVRPKMRGECAGRCECLAACGALMTSRSLRCNMRLSVLFVLELFALASATFGFPLALAFGKRCVHPILLYTCSRRCSPQRSPPVGSVRQGFTLTRNRAPLRSLTDSAALTIADEKWGVKVSKAVAWSRGGGAPRSASPERFAPRWRPKQLHSRGQRSDLGGSWKERLQGRWSRRRSVVEPDISWLGPSGEGLQLGRKGGFGRGEKHFVALSGA